MKTVVSNLFCVTVNLKIQSPCLRLHTKLFHKTKFYARLLINKIYQYQENIALSSIPADFYNPLDLVQQTQSYPMPCTISVLIRVVM